MNHSTPHASSQQPNKQIDPEDCGEEDSDDDQNTSLRQQSLSQVHLNDTESPTSSQNRKYKLSIDYTSAMAIKPLDKASPSMKSFNNKSDVWSLKKFSKSRLKTKETHSTPSTLPKNQEKNKSKNRSSTSINQTDLILEKQTETVSMSSANFLAVIASNIKDGDNSCSASNASSLLQIEFTESGARSSLKHKFHKRNSKSSSGLKETPTKSSMRTNEVKNFENSLSSSKSGSKDEGKISLKN